MKHSRSINWREYQEQVATFFRRLGLSASVEHELEGARGLHAVDVYVQGSFHGVPLKWVVECKAWKSNVPKEKVMALAAIVQDVGADRGFLLSEVGFQSGTVRASHKTNITLSSLEDLSSSAEEALTDAALGGLNWRLQKARNRLREIRKQKYDDSYYPPMMRPLGNLHVLEMALADALNDKYPNIYLIEDDVRYTVDSLDELLKVADEIIAEAESWSGPEE
jgi:hypothetical protein